MGSITMITSGKDGAGKSALTVLIGEALAAMGRKVICLELDNGPGSMDTFAGVREPSCPTIADIMSGRCSCEEAACVSSANENLKVICATPGRSNLHLADMTGDIIALSQVYDHVLVDTECRTDTLQAVSAVAMHTIAVTPPDPLSLSYTKAMCDRLYASNTPDLRLLVNRITAGHISGGTIRSIDSCIDAVGVRLIGAVPESDDIRSALFKGRALPGRSVYAKIMSNIAARIEGEDVPPAITVLHS